MIVNNRSILAPDCILRFARSIRIEETEIGRNVDR